MNYSENYKLKLPEAEDYYNVDDFNENAKIIDGALKELDENALKAEYDSGSGAVTLYKGDGTISCVWNPTSGENTLEIIDTGTNSLWTSAVKIEYEGETLSTAYKMESASGFGFTAKKAGTLTVVTYSTNSSPTIVIDGTDYAVSKNGAAVIDVTAGSHMIVKGTTNTYLYYARLDIENAYVLSEGEAAVAVVTPDGTSHPLKDDDALSKSEGGTVVGDVTVEGTLKAVAEKIVAKNIEGYGGIGVSGTNVTLTASTTDSEGQATAGDINLSGNIGLGGGAVTVTNNLNTHKVIPTANDTYVLGQSGARYAEVNAKAANFDEINFATGSGNGKIYMVDEDIIIFGSGVTKIPELGLGSSNVFVDTIESSLTKSNYAIPTSEAVYEALRELTNPIFIVDTSDNFFEAVAKANTFSINNGGILTTVYVRGDHDLTSDLANYSDAGTAYVLKVSGNVRIASFPSLANVTTLTNRHRTLTLINSDLTAIFYGGIAAAEGVFNQITFENIIFKLSGGVALADCCGRLAMTNCCVKYDSVTKAKGVAVSQGPVYITNCVFECETTSADIYEVYLLNSGVQKTICNNYFTNSLYYSADLSDVVQSGIIAGNSFGSADNLVRSASGDTTRIFNNEYRS